MPRGGLEGSRKHVVTAKTGAHLAEFLSYLTSHAYGTGRIEKSEGIYNAAKPQTPIVGNKPPPLSYAGKKYTAPGVASTLTLRGLNLGKDTSYGPLIPSAIINQKKSLSNKVVKGYLLELTNEDIAKITDLAKKVWVVLAEKRLEGAILYEYLRAMRVEWKNDALSLRLEGWEAASKEIGWAPKAGGLDAGLGRYDGMLHDLRPLVLGGKSKKIIPLKIEGSTSDFESSITNQLLNPYRRADRENPENVKRVKAIASEEAQRVLQTKPGEAVRLKAARGSKAFRSNIRSNQGSSWGRPDFSSVKYHEDNKNYYQKQVGKNIKFGDEEVFVRYSKNILQGAVRAKVVRKPSQGRDSEGTFVAFRTMVATNFSPKTSARRKDGSWKRYVKRFSHVKEAKKLNNYYKWFTEGREPYKLMEIVLTKIRNYINDLVIGKRASLIKEQFEDFSKSFIKVKMGIEPEEGASAEISGILSKAFDRTLSGLEEELAMSKKKKRRR